MKRMKKIVSMLLAAIMVLGMSMTVFASEGYGATNSHTIVIDNTDQNVSHQYAAYQIFSGNLDAKEEKLADIKWGSDVNKEDLVKALYESNDSLLTTVKAAVTKEDGNMVDVEAAAVLVAEAISKFGNTTGANESAGAIDAFASIVALHVIGDGVSFTENTEDTPTAKKDTYSATVVGDGYYFIKDTTGNDDLTGEDGSDTRSKYLLSIVRDTEIVAKDTGLVLDKEIVEGTERVKEGTAAIGDEVTFEVTIDVPNTTKYEKDFKFVMNDQLPVGLTFMGVKSVAIGGKTLTSGTNYRVEAAENGIEYGTYQQPDSAAEAVTKAGGQKIRVTFIDFKQYVEANSLVGNNSKVVVTYTAVVNDDATYGATANENEVKFDYSNDPNYDYDGDDFGDNDPKGTTPESKTKTYVTGLDIFKYYGDETTKNPLAGAEFTIIGTEYNITLVTGQRYVPDSNGTYWKLLDGSYTATPPTTANINTTQYEDPDTKYRLETYTNEVTGKPTDTKIVVVSDQNGKVTIKGLKPGEYTVEETKAPDGYNKIDGQLKLVISWNNPDAENASEELKAKGGFSISSDSTGNWVLNNDGSLYMIDVLNKSGVNLPSTGGIGTTIFYVGGSILVLAAVILLVAKKRMSAEK